LFARESRIHRLPLLRRICQKTGLVLASVDYDFTLAQPFAACNVLDIQVFSSFFFRGFNLSVNGCD
jgi:hypothetical protein